jgi:uncharacterized protein YfaP (DUF2135 family)
MLNQIAWYACFHRSGHAVRAIVTAAAMLIYVGQGVLAREADARDCSFQAAASFAAGKIPGSGPTGTSSPLAVADFDGDSIPDLVTVNLGGGGKVLLGNGDGSFQAAASFAAGGNPDNVAVADLNGDTVLDLVTANSNSEPGDVNVLLGNGDGSFQSAVSFAVGNRPSSIAVADLDGDSIPDLVTANLGNYSNDPGDVSLLLGNGDGSFQAAVSLAAGDGPHSIAVADVDGDTTPDLVVANRFSGDVSVLLGNGDGSFQPAVSSPAGNQPLSVTVADLNGDTILDLVMVNFLVFEPIGYVSVLLGNGDGSFRPRTLVGSGSLSATAADVDGDTIPDLITARGGSWDSHNKVSVQRGNGDGTFQAPVSFAAGDNPGNVAVADFNGDMIPDIVTANPDAGRVTVLLGNGDGGFQAGAWLYAERSALSVTVADVDHDTIPDLVAAVGYPGVAVLRGNGDGNFQPVTFISVGARFTSTTAVVVVDLDGDTILDLATVNRGGGGNVLLGNGDGSFGASFSFETSDFTGVSIAVGDLNSDTIPDLVTANSGHPTLPGGNDLSVLLGNGDGSFQAPVSITAGLGPVSVAAADLDGDTHLDLVVANSDSDDVSVLLGRGDGSFQVPVSIAVGENPTSLAVAHLDGDANLDLVVANSDSNDVSVLLGKGDGSFQDPVSIAAGNNPTSIAVADLDGDSNLDLVFVGFPSEVRVLRGNGEGGFQAPTSFTTGGNPSSLAVADLDGDTSPDLAIGAWQGGHIAVHLQVCDPSPVPAASNGAIVALGMLLLSGGVVLIHRRGLAAWRTLSA